MSRPTKKVSVSWRGKTTGQGDTSKSKLYNNLMTKFQYCLYLSGHNGKYDEVDNHCINKTLIFITMHYSLNTNRTRYYNLLKHIKNDTRLYYL